jgi:hypothetical protein
MQRGIRELVRSMVHAVLPSLRVVALVYTGLSGVAVLVLVVTASVVPKAPIVQQVTEPARQVVTTFVQPTTDMIGSLIPAPVAAPPIVPAPPTADPFVDTTALDVTIDVAPAPVAAYSAPVRRPVVRVAPMAPAVDGGAVEDDTSEDLPAEDAPVATTPEPMLEPAQTPMVQMASAEPPKPLPTVVPTPVPETPQMIKARMDAANQAAIDAARAAAAKAKADADAANQAAIDAQKAAANAPTLSDAAVTVPTPNATASQAANQAVIDATRTAAVRAKATADAANQAAIDAAKAKAKP